MDFEFFWSFFNIVGLRLDFEIYLNFFKTVLIEFELWILFLNMYTHMIELAYNCWTLLAFANPTVLHLVDIPLFKGLAIQSKFFQNILSYSDLIGT